MNATAESRLKSLERGKSLPLTRRPSPHCPECSYVVHLRRSRRRCPKCRARLLRPRAPCRLCDLEVPKGRRSWCSDGCRHLYYMATSSSYLRYQTWQRDKGVCRSCQLDCDKLERTTYGYSTMQKLPTPRSSIARSADELAAICEMLRRDFGFNVSPSNRSSMWHADHVIPLSEGGGFDMDNIQTLCTPCHQDKTSDEASMRASRRRLTGRKQTETRRRLMRAGVK